MVLLQQQKGIAAFFTGSASMMAEAIHSTADCGNQVLVLIGQNQAKKGNQKPMLLDKAKQTSFGLLLLLLFYFFTWRVILYI